MTLANLSIVVVHSPLHNVESTDLTSQLETRRKTQWSEQNSTSWLQHTLLPAALEAGLAPSGRATLHAE